MYFPYKLMYIWYLDLYVCVFHLKFYPLFGDATLWESINF